MKLSKVTLVKKTSDELNKLGYHEMKDKFIVADGLFAKILENGMFLTLGFTVSNFYEARFTASYYLSKTTTWGALWGDIPKTSYKRVGHYLSKEERKLLAPENDENHSDVWWNYSIESIFSFIRAVQITEDRFLSQDGLIGEVKESSVIDRLFFLSNEVIAAYQDREIPDREYQFTPKKDKFIDIKWFKIAEIILLNENETANSHTVRRLAADAYRQYYLRNLKYVVLQAAADKV